MTAGNLTYNVRTIQVSEGELTAYTVDDENVGVLFTGVSYREAYGFSGNSFHFFFLFFFFLVLF